MPRPGNDPSAAAQWKADYLAELVHQAGGPSAVARELGCDRRRVDMVTSGRRSLSDPELRKWALALGLAEVRALIPPGLPPPEKEKEKKRDHSD